jgi:hypothetical protein
MSYSKKEVMIAVLLFLGGFLFYLFLPELSTYLWFKIAIIILLAGITFYVL